MSFECKRCRNELELFKDPDIGIEEKILIQPCRVCEKQIRDGAREGAWRNPHREDMGK